jgi:hypothetical protein
MPTPTPPSRRDVHAAILWCARWRMGDGEQYLGPISVEIKAKKKAEKIVVEPRNKADGLTLPPALGAPPSASVSAYELIKVFLSREERVILVTCMKNPKWLVKDVQESTKIQNGRFYALWTNLKDRGLVAKAEQGGGFVILVPWLAALLTELDQPAELQLAAGQND